LITLWHNPRCSKSRAALALLQEAGAPLTLRRYLEDAPDLAEIKRVHAVLGGAVIDMMRPSEARFKELGLGRETDPDTLLAAMADNPILIERPIAMTATRAVIGRPPEQMLDLL
jgi:arsenate reductase